MSKSKILYIILTGVLVTTFVVGCNNIANAKMETVSLGNNATTSVSAPDSADIKTIAADFGSTMDEESEIIPFNNDELVFFNGDSFFNGEYLNMCNQFLSSLYSVPGDIDLFELFYNGTRVYSTKAMVIGKNLGTSTLTVTVGGAEVECIVRVVRAG